PVKDIDTGKCCITSQNHNYAVASKNIPDGIRLTHVNVNDKTIEGFRHNTLPLLSVQYHPEAAPGPEDSVYIFDDFVKMMEKGRSNA
ncbi:MAG: carbamoyl phosphate synthase small subunit, partial [Clostridiales bacterium]|nr:carbamoyl phosphate synthase small subunit [Clostridiales bacterium]